MRALCGKAGIGGGCISHMGDDGAINRRGDRAVAGRPKGFGDTKLGESVLDGSGATTFTSGPFHVLGSTTVEIRYLGDTTHDASSDSVTVDVTLAEATVHATATPGSVEVRNGTVRIDVTVDSPGPTPTGTVQYLIGGSRVASSTLAPDGTTSAVLGPFSAAGDVPVEVRYLGDDSTTAASDTVTVAVTKTATTTTLRLSRSTVQVTAGTTTATARVSSRLGAAGGTVDFLVDGAVVATATLADGRASAVLGPFGIVGGSTVEARYAGTAVLAWWYVFRDPAIDLRVPSLGIPFAESLQVQSEPIAAPAAPGSAPAAPTPPRYVVRVCANVPPDLLPPAEALRVETFVLPAAKAYAALCDAADENPCRQALQAKMQADLKLTRAQLEVVQWQVVQPISERSDVDGLRAGLTDFKARPLNSDVPAPLLLRDKLILWATAPSGG